MKFDRQYEPAILVYRETRAPGRLLLRLGRLQDDGSHTLEETAAIEKTFTFATHILTKDTRGLLARLRKCLEEFSMDAEGNLDAVIIDYPALQAALQRAGGGKLAAELESIWGAAALEAILALPVLTTPSQRRRIAAYLSKDEDGPEKQTNTYPKWLPYAIGGFVFMILVPALLFFVLQPEKFQAMQRQAQGVLFKYAENAPDLASSHSSGGGVLDYILTPEEAAAAAEREALMERLRKAKQELYIAADFGPLDDTFSATRNLMPPAAISPSLTDVAEPNEAGVPPESLGDPVPPAEVTDTEPAHEVADAQPPKDLPDAAVEVDDAGLGQSLEIPFPEASVMTEAASLGIPIDLAKMRLLRFNTFDSIQAGDGIDIAAKVATAVYDIRRGPAVVFDATPADMDGLTQATDDAVRSICAAMGTPIVGASVSSDDIPDDMQALSVSDPAVNRPGANITSDLGVAETEGQAPLIEATLSVQAGRSDIAGIVINQETCAQSSYNVFTLFEFVPQEPEANSDAEDGVKDEANL